MKNYFKMFKKNIAANVLYLFPVLYFWFLLRFYIIDYYAQDFRVYSEWALANYMSKEGYSSLWIQICGFITIAPRLMTILCLVLLAVSLFFMTKAAYNFLYKRNQLYYWLSVLIIYSASIWYYFYGKIFYDFPFTAASYGFLFYIVSRMYILIGGGKEKSHTDTGIISAS